MYTSFRSGNAQADHLAFDWATGDEDIGTVLRYHGHISDFEIIFLVFFANTIQNKLPASLTDLVNVSHEGREFPRMVVIREFSEIFLENPIR